MSNKTEYQLRLPNIKRNFATIGEANAEGMSYFKDFGIQSSIVEVKTTVETKTIKRIGRG
jgi:hypothetical protein